MESIRSIALAGCLCALVSTAACQTASAQQRGSVLFKGINGSLTQRREVIAQLPMQRLTKRARQRILAVADSPTLYRRLPRQSIDCDRDMFLFLARNPEVLVGIWDLMGITRVQTRRVGPYQLEAVDGSGTTCNVDLVYGDPNVHIYVADGSYDGALVARPVRGKGVFVLRSEYSVSDEGETVVSGTIDCFLQVESLGVDLIARTLSGVIGRSADNNFIETAKFIGQISDASKRNAPAMIDVAQRLPQVTRQTRSRFAEHISVVADRALAQSRVARRSR